MSPDQPLPALEALQAQLRGALDQQLAAVKQHYDDAVVEARRQAAADAERATAASLDQARKEWESQLAAAVAAARAEALQQAAQSAAAEREALEREFQDKLTLHTESAAAQKAELERQLQQKLAEHTESAAAQKAELERQMQQKLAEQTESAAAQKAELERQMEQKVAQHVESAASQRAELEQMQQELAQHVESSAAQKAELERQMEEKLAQHTESAAAQQRELEQQMEQRLAQHSESSAAQQRELEQRLQLQMDQQIELHVGAARRAAQLELESERRRGLSEMEAEREHARIELEALKDRAQADVAKARAAAAAAVAAVPKAAPVAGAAAPAPDAMTPAATPLARVPLAIQDLDATRSLSQALESLLTHAGAIAGRAALFLINGDRLRAWKACGIPDVDVQTVESSIGAKDQLARAIQAGQSLASGPSLPPPPFARLAADRVGLASPVMIGGRAVAVLYADNGASSVPAPAGWQAAIDLIVRHAAALVALRTAMRTLDVLNGVEPAREGVSSADHPDEGVQGARRYARLLVSEIKLYNEAAVRDGRQQRDLLQRLRVEIERAQRLYEERIPPAVASRQQYFQQELVQTLADGDAALLGNA